MQVTVLLFAYLKEIAGEERIGLCLSDGAVVSDVWPLLIQKFPRFEGMEKSLAWAVNHEYVNGSLPLKDGDFLAALPPISGGCRIQEPSLHG